MRIALCLALLCATAAPYAQTDTPTQQPAATPDLAFETASIRPVHVTPGCYSMSPPGGSQYALTCITLRYLMGTAYNTGYIDGDKDALDNVYYDLRATTPGGTPLTAETVRPMVRQLLVQRFGLVVHPGKRELSGYGLVLAKGGSRLHPADPAKLVQGQKAGEPSQNFLYAGVVQGRGLDARGIAGLLSAVLHAPVEDHTGLSGIYNIDLRYKPDNDTDPADENLPSFFTAVEEQLGLKLQPQKVTVDTIVIDRVNPDPTPN
jgi:uncharacterized protein (TIGR03435 family)